MDLVSIDLLSNYWDIGRQNIMISKDLQGVFQKFPDFFKRSPTSSATYL